MAAWLAEERQVGGTCEVSQRLRPEWRGASLFSCMVEHSSSKQGRREVHEAPLEHGVINEMQHITCHAGSQGWLLQGNEYMVEQSYSVLDLCTWDHLLFPFCGKFEKRLSLHLEVDAEAFEVQVQHAVR